MSHDEGSSHRPTARDRDDVREASETDSVGDPDDESSSLRDTAPGTLPAMDFSKTLPTGAAFHATWRIPNLAADGAPDPGQESGVHAVDRSSDPRSDLAAGANAMANPPNSRASDAAKRATTPMKFSVPPLGHPADDSLHLGTTRREFVQPKLSPREKAKRNILTHTLQMPLVVTPIPQPSAARAVDQAVRLAATQRQGTLPMPLPGGWTSVHRVGSSATAEPSASRPPQARATEPMPFGNRRPDSREPRRDEARGSSRPHADEVHAEPVRVHPALQDHSSFVRPQTVPVGTMQDSSRWTQLRTGDYERVTLPGEPIRVPELSGREWMFIALLACASAATLYSLMVDDFTSAAEEESVEAATTVEHQHLVRPALPNPPARPANQAVATATASATGSAAAHDTTELVSEPSSAEIIVGGAVIGNTPAKVVRGASTSEYLLRKPGYVPQLVRVTPNSPKAITITLHPK